MKISKLMVDNFLGIRSITVDLNVPITLFCGPNGSGKSSLRDAIKMAMTGEAERVSLKKDYTKLVRKDEKAGGALIKSGDLAYSFNIPAGNREVSDGLPVGTSVEVALNGQRFASMTPDERRTFLFKVAGCKASAEEVHNRLLARQCDAAKIEAVLPMLRTGFPAAAEYAAEQAKQAKRDWRAQTGATWGANVAEKWKADQPKAPAATETKPEDIAALDAEIASLNQKIGAAAAEIRNANDAAAKREQLKAKADSVERVREQRDRAEVELEEFLPKVKELRERATGTARVGLLHSLAYAVEGLINEAQDIETMVYKNAVAVLDDYEAEHGPLPQEGTADADAKASLPEYERGYEVLQNKAKNLDRDLEQAVAAKTAYDALQPEDGSTVTAGDLDALQTRLTTLKDSRMRVQAELLACEQHDKAVKAAEDKTVRAASHHKAVVAWLEIADALAPDGIPGELLAEALKPINSTLQIAAADTGWLCVYIEPDMQITYGKREYALLSESEQWRVDAMIAQAISKISGLKLLMLDRVDVLDLPSRGALLDWLVQLADDGHIETALLFATLKALPAGLPKEIAAHWIENGSVKEMKVAA